MFIKNRSIKQRAFTLIEVITVSLIIGILIYAASTSIPRISEDFYFKNNITKIEYLAKRTKLKAIQKSRYVGVCVDYQNNRLIQKTLDTYSKPTETEGICDQKYTKNPDLIVNIEGTFKLKTDSTYSQNFIFDGRGIAMFHSNSAIEANPCITNTKQYAQIKITKTGISVVKGNGSCP